MKKKSVVIFGAGDTGVATQTVLENENNNVDGTWYITYTEDEKKDFEKDYKEILESQKTEKWVTVKNIIKYIIIPLGFAVFSWWIEKNI
jgi:UDP-N-acetylmuramoylalanine-D-glutamate ligase